MNIVCLIFYIFYLFTYEDTEVNHERLKIKSYDYNNQSLKIIDSIKVIDCKEFKLVFSQFNKEFNLWYSPKLIVDGDTILITGLDNENGAELSINKSPNSNYFVIDNIIKGYIENSNGEKILHENFMCVIVNVKEAKVEQSLQSECDGAWNEQNEWVSAGNVVFAP